MKYQDGKIYRILNTESDDVYVGSTCQKLSKRMTNHRTDANRGINSALYQQMREIGIDRFYIELIETFPCESLEQLNKREGEWMREIATLNEKVAGRTKKEYKSDYKESINEKGKVYYQENKEKYYDKEHIIKKIKSELMNEIRNMVKNIRKKESHIHPLQRKQKRHTIKNTTMRIKYSGVRNTMNGWHRARLRLHVKFVIVNTLGMTEHIIYKENIM